MGLGRKARRKTKPEMNVTPLVDVVLVLLIIFMIVIPASQGVQVEYPAIENPDEESPEDAVEPIVLSINRNGTFFLNDGIVPEDELEQFLVSAHRAQPRARLVLRGDRGVPYVNVRTSFATAQAVGFPGISLRVNFDEGDVRQGQE